MDITVSVTLPRHIVDLARSLTTNKPFVANLALSAFIVRRGEALHSFNKVIKALVKVYQDNSREISLLRKSTDMGLLLNAFDCRHVPSQNLRSLLFKDLPQELEELRCFMSLETIVPPNGLAGSTSGQRLQPHERRTIAGKFEVLQYVAGLNTETRQGRPPAPYSRQGVLWGIRGLFDRLQIPVSINTWPGNSVSPYLKIAQAVFKVGGVDLSVAAIKKLADRAGISEKTDDIGALADRSRGWYTRIYPVVFLPGYGWNCRNECKYSEVGFTVQSVFSLADI